MPTPDTSDEQTGLPPYRLVSHTAPLHERFPVAENGFHYPHFDLQTGKVVYSFPKVSTVAPDWPELRYMKVRGRYRVIQTDQTPLL